MIGDKYANYNPLAMDIPETPLEKMTFEEKQNIRKKILTKYLDYNEYSKSSLFKFPMLLLNFEIFDYSYEEKMLTSPIDYEAELNRLNNADYELAMALLSMQIARYMGNYDELIAHYSKGEFTPIIEKVIYELDKNGCKD